MIDNRIQIKFKLYAICYLFSEKKINDNLRLPNNMRIHILTTNNFISYYFFYPLLANKRRLRELNIILKYYEKIREDIYDCDAILLDSKYFTKLWNNRENGLSLLKRIKEKCAKVIWLDSTASTGSTHFQVMPYVVKSSSALSYCRNSE